MLEQGKRIYMKLYKYIFNVCYIVLSNMKKHDNNKAVFVLTRENKLQGNLQFVYSELRKQYPEVKIHYVYAENKMNLKLFKELNSICNARYLIINDYYLPIYLIKPNYKIKVIQLWHAAGAFKKFGHSTVGTKFGPSKEYLKVIPVHANYTHVYVSSVNVIPYYAEAFNMSEENIYPLGIPRIDMFNDRELQNKIINDMYEQYPVLESKDYIKILIAPTYRATGQQGESVFNMVESVKRVASYLKDNIQLLLKLHPYTSTEELISLKKYNNIMIIDHYSLNEWMLVADAFITDYSSAVFDFSLLHKPLAHFVPDITEYGKNRGFYQEISQISDGMIIQSDSELIKWLNKRQHREYYDTTRMISYNFSQTKDVTKKIVQHFIDKPEEV